ncbi:unnamed protein product [Mytilus edulis]|uniref:Uncharacterized protein n=1 Tax=Mytilus edulis TaxID=6550 RepID=A0A8S3SKX2_MYTED|nr:unnamed protein product [Mytilus edulis]
MMTFRLVISNQLVMILRPLFWELGLNTLKIGLIPSVQDRFDTKFFNLVNNDIEILTDIFLSTREPIQEVTEYELNKCILSFKNGKAPDVDKFTIEHLKYGGQTVVNILTKLINLIFKTVAVPNNLKIGIGCPLFKNGGKPKEDPNSYRRITITSAIGKTIEKLHLSRNKSSIKNQQSSIYCGAPTVADDVTLIANDPYELQTMINIQMDHANKFRYSISEQKSCVLKIGDKSEHSWYMNDQKLNTPINATHLGIKRDINSKFGVKEVVPDRIQTARKTVYALMGAGLYGLNGINPKVSVHMIKCFVIPRLLYGLDII